MGSRSATSSISSVLATAAAAAAAAKGLSRSPSPPTCPARLLARSNPSLPSFLPSLLSPHRSGRPWVVAVLWVGSLAARTLARARALALARAQSASLKGFSPLVPLVPPRRATLADAAAERGASRRPCRRRPPTRRAQGPIALLPPLAHARKLTLAVEEAKEREEDGGGRLTQLLFARGG